MNESQRLEFEAFMEARFGDCIDRRRCKNGDGNDYMSFDMGMARIVWQHMQQQLNAVVAENAALKSVFTTEEVPECAVDAFKETAIMDHDWNDTGEWSWVENDTDVIRAVLEAIKPETPDTDAYLSAVRAEGVDLAINHLVGKFRATGRIGVPVMALESLAKQLRTAAPKGDSDEE